MSDRTVLCVDDEVHVLRSLERLLRKEEYRVVTAEGGTEGLAVLGREPVQLILSDQRMPRMTGVEFLQKAKEIRPEAVRVILSGYADVGVVVDAINKGEVYRFLTKPWSDQELKNVIAECLGHYEIIERSRGPEREVLTGGNRAQPSDEYAESLDERVGRFYLSPRILEKLPIPAIGVGKDGAVLVANRPARELFAAGETRTLARSLQDRVPPAMAHAAVRWLARLTPSSEPLFLEWGKNPFTKCPGPTASSPWTEGCLLLLAAPSVETSQRALNDPDNR